MSKKDKKNKKYTKIAELIYKESQKLKYDNEPCVKTESIDINICDYDEKLSNKFENFILNLITLKDKIRIEMRSDCIYINGNLNNNYNNSKNIGIDDILDIRITPEYFTISRNYNSSVSYKDNYIFNRLKNDIVEKCKEINHNLLVDMIDDVMIKTNLNRGSNLDKLLN